MMDPYHYPPYGPVMPPHQHPFDRTAMQPPIDRYQVCHSFYRAMHFSAKRGIAIACRLSVRPSVRPSVCDVGEL